MVLGYLAQNPSNTLWIVPCGLNFFNRHQFQSRSYADFGVPITVPGNLVGVYREGGEAKKKVKKKEFPPFVPVLPITRCKRKGVIGNKKN